MANPIAEVFDPWVVVFGTPLTYVFGPFEGRSPADAFKREHGGEVWPLLGENERDCLDGEPWIAQATREAASPLSETAA